MEYLVCEPFLTIYIAFQSKDDANTYTKTARPLLRDPALSDYAKRARLDMLLATLPHRIRVLPMPLTLPFDLDWLNDRPSR